MLEGKTEKIKKIASGILGIVAAVVPSYKSDSPTPDNPTDPAVKANADNLESYSFPSIDGIKITPLGENKSFDPGHHVLERFDFSFQPEKLPSDELRNLCIEQLAKRQKDFYFTRANCAYEIARDRIVIATTSRSGNFEAEITDLNNATENEVAMKFGEALDRLIDIIKAEKEQYSSNPFSNTLYFCLTQQLCAS